MLRKSLAALLLAAILIGLPLSTARAFSWLDSTGRAELDRLLVGLQKNLETLTRDLRAGREVVVFLGGIDGGKSQESLFGTQF